MSKYDFEMTLSQNTSTGIILNQIEKQSVVLEFGCATGRMTRYMKETLDCRVYIVEIDESAYKIALQYAEDGLCDDILNFRWTEKFQGITFDAIIFADVLEHLICPEKVLECAAKLLKDTGRLYVSLPNITHNDILLKAYAEHFDYTETGLLDDTHVHFWGLENIRSLSGKCGLNIRKVEGTYCATGDTEQYAQIDRNENLLLENILKERQCGEVYQFVVTFDKNDSLEAVYSFKTPSVRSHVYLDTGNDFNPEGVAAVDAVYSGDGSYRVHYVVENAGEIKRVRLDPVEFQGCILRKISINQGGKELSLIIPNRIMTESGILLPGDDPMVYAEVASGDEPIIIDAEIILPGVNYLEMIEDACADKNTAFEQLCGEVNAERQEFHKALGELSGENVRLQQTLVVLTEEKTGLENRISVLTEEKAALENGITVLKSEKAKLEGEIVSLIEEKTSLENDLSSLNAKNNALEGEISVLTEEKAGLEKELARLSEEKAGLEKELAALTGEKIGLEERVAVLSGEKAELEKRVAALIAEGAGLREVISSLVAENVELHRDIGAYITLANNKEKYILTLENELKEYRGIEKYMRILKKAVNCCRNLKFARVRMRAFFIRASRGAGRRIRRVLKKEENV